MQVNNLKVDKFEQANDLALTVTTDVQLVPVGGWIFSQPALIDQMAKWRQENMAMFCAKFDSTATKTRDYLNNSSIGQSNRILFLIFENQRMVGHLGLSNIIENSAEVDNVMRGALVGTRSLMQLCIERLIEWAKSELELTKLQLKVVSINNRAIALYERCGFAIASSSAMKAVLQPEVTQFVDCSDEEATTPVRSLIMTRVI